MLQSTILITLLAGSVIAAPLAEGSVKTTTECTSLTASSTPIDEGYGPTLASQPVQSAPTSASIIPSVTVAPEVPSTPVPDDDDEPAIFVSYTFSWSSEWDAATFTERFYPSTLPTPKSSLMPITTPASIPTGAPEVPNTPLPAETTCTEEEEEEAQKTRTPLDTATPSASPSTIPTDADSTFSSPNPTGNSTLPTAPPRPTSTGSPDEYEGEDYGYGYGHPRPSGKWPFMHQPSGGLYHPTGGLHRPMRPSPSSTTCTEETEATSTMQTSVRPTLTAGGY
ncbi:hypothetical protein CFE70_007282 [Pyrenophora teres f. teres 0-1]|uniref:Uncharacterized protein n=1 Tax=Pyrenophora teres f. teres (strain 0-1) TaxID=861557 RepID=E3S7W1_PYRTT|nr:hypothetical protein PTT_18961 [Pyrenophora teres f. teres 0-1]